MTFKTMKNFRQHGISENQSQSNGAITKGTEDHPSYTATMAKINHEGRAPFRVDTSDSEQTQTYNDFLDKNRGEKAKIVKGESDIDLSKKITKLYDNDKTSSNQDAKQSSESQK